jgi:hypothetical protein
MCCCRCFLIAFHTRRHACVKLLCELGLYEDAVPLALAVDLGLAKAVANSPEDDDALRRKLWLSIAKHVVQVCMFVSVFACVFPMLFLCLKSAMCYVIRAQLVQRCSFCLGVCSLCNMSHVCAAKSRLLWYMAAA